MKINKPKFNLNTILKIDRLNKENHNKYKIYYGQWFGGWISTSRLIEMVNNLHKNQLIK